MLRRLAFPCVTAVAIASGPGFAQSPSPNGVKTLDPPGAIKAEGTWSLGARAGDFVFVAGMQGIDPAANTLVQDPQARIRQAFLNIRLIAQSEGASLQDCVRITVYVSDLHRFAPMVDKAQAELGASRHIHPARWSRSSVCLTMISSRSTASFTPQRKSEPAAGWITNIGATNSAMMRRTTASGPSRDLACVEGKSALPRQPNRRQQRTGATATSRTRCRERRLLGNAVQGGSGSPNRPASRRLIASASSRTSRGSGHWCSRHRHCRHRRRRRLRARRAPWSPRMNAVTLPSLTLPIRMPCLKPGLVLSRRLRVGDVDHRRSCR